MNCHPRLVTASQVPRRTWVALWLVLSLLFQGTLLMQQAVAMAGGTEVCSAASVGLEAADDPPLTGNPHDRHDCWNCVDLLALPASPQVPAPETQFAAPVTVLAHGRLHAPWFGPLARGPPQG
ncbi:MAG: DUF2946 family protein [Leptothrix sp. (in: b-proteobacteria)]